MALRADRPYMSPRRLRSRLLDLAVATVCVACVGAPLLPVVNAADGPENSVVESSGTVDQRVLEGGIISNPLNGSFQPGGRGTVDGSFSWDLYSTNRDGMKLTVSTDRSPAMRDANGNVDIPDYAAAPSAWRVSGSDRRFGFSVSGGLALSRFEDGARWRGFDGRRAVEIARRSGPVPRTRTTVKLRAEFAAPLASGARPTATVYATAVPNL